MTQSGGSGASPAASAGLTAAKAIIGLLTGSLAVLSEAGHSLLDLAATVLTYVAVRVSGKPADAEHQYGHGKVESITALAETALLFLLAAVVLYEAAQRLIGERVYAVEATAVAFVIIVAVDRCRFLPRPHARPYRRRNIEWRRSKPTRCISAPTCGRRSRS